MNNPFENNEICDGAHCVEKGSCARWMMHCDFCKCNPYVVFNTRQRPDLCPYWLPIPNENYPQI